MLQIREDPLRMAPTPIRTTRQSSMMEENGSPGSSSTTVETTNSISSVKRKELKIKPREIERNGKKSKSKSSDPKSIRTTRQSSKLEESAERESSRKTRSMWKRTVKTINFISKAKTKQREIRTLKRKIPLPDIDPNTKRIKSSHLKFDQKSEPADQNKEKGEPTETEIDKKEQNPSPPPQERDLSTETTDEKTDLWSPLVREKDEEEEQKVLAGWKVKIPTMKSVLEEKAELQTEKLKLQEENDKLRNEINSVKQNRDELEQKEENLQTELDKINQLNEQLQVDVDIQKESLHNLTIDLESTKTQLGHAETEKLALEHDKQSLEATAEKMKDNITTMGIQTQRLEKDLESAKRENRSLLLTKNTMNMINEKLKKLSEENTENLIIKAQLETEVKRLNTIYQEAETELKNSKEEKMCLNVSIEKLKQEEEQLQKNLDTEKKESYKLKKICNFMKTERKSFLESEQKISEKEDEIKNEMRGLRDLIRNLENKIETMKKENSNLKNENIKNQIMLLAKKDQEIQKVRELQREAEETNKAYEQKGAELKKENTALKNCIIENQDMLVKQEQEIQRQSSNIKNQMMLLAKKDQEIQKVRELQKEAEEAKKSHEKMETLLRTENTALRDNHYKNQKLLVKKGQENQNLRESQKKAEEKMNADEKTKAELKMENNALQNLIKLAKQKAEIQRLKKDQEEKKAAELMSNIRSVFDSDSDDERENKKDSTPVSKPSPSPTTLSALRVRPDSELKMKVPEEQEFQRYLAPPNRNIPPSQPLLPPFSQTFQSSGGTGRAPVISRAPPPLQYQPSQRAPMLSEVPTPGKSKPVILRKYFARAEAGTGAGDRPLTLLSQHAWYPPPTNPVQMTSSTSQARPVQRPSNTTITLKPVTSEETRSVLKPANTIHTVTLKPVNTEEIETESSIPSFPHEEVDRLFGLR